MYCQKCGKKLKRGEKFCSNCGNFCDVNNEKKENNGRKISLVMIIVIFILIINLVPFYSYNFFKSENKSSSEKSEEKIETRKLENISFDYDLKEWKMTIYNSRDSEILENDKGKMEIQEVSKYYLDYEDLEEYVNEFKNNCVYPCEVIEDINTVNINSKLWFKFAISRNDYNNLYLYAADDDRTYMVIYTAKSSDYYSGLSKAEKVYKTIFITPYNSNNYTY